MKEFVNEERLEQLKELLCVLADAIDSQPGMRDLAGLIRQYRETLREIEEIEGGPKEDDELCALLAKRQSDGRPSSVR